MKKTNIDESVEKLEEITDPNTVVSIGGINFTPAKLMVAATIISTTLGGLYGAFEVYKRFVDMQDAIESYVTPDLTEMYEKIAVSDKKMDGIEKSVTQATDYTSDIKNDLKGDIRRLENVVENVERSSKQNQRETDAAVKEVQKETANTVKEVQRELRASQKEMERALKAVEQNVDNKIKKALDNPLNN